ncbi:LOW QUALITY PROTEIN: hypothetical protein PHMEG_00027212 [Phytophthora megakarya]|uniref:Uncharacterized protein n=1 Tax=Phytophthora megakarya TaxID=4795 RepID=A0A225V6A9_9STRA|nr:LOW QUALITY PROTEIN: hypothetical protein PHMEG_00027212 [Phytophthora megakarya]
MTGPKHAQKKARREDGGREDESLRRSRRKQGLPPLEYKDLDVVVRESRATKKAAQDAERAVAQEQPVSEPAAGDAQALSSVASSEAPLSESGTTRVEGEPTHPESAQASVGGADMVEPPVEEVTPKPGQDGDVELLEEKAPPMVQNLTADDSVPESESKKIVRRTVVRVKSEPTSVPEAAELGLAAQATSGSAGSESSQADALAKAYVAHQEHRWEQVPSGRVLPPQVVYTWSEVPDYASWLEEAKAVSDFVLQQACMDNRDKAWISELRPERRGFGPIQVPVTLLEARQCAAVLQTLFFEAGFQFNNAVPEWFRTHAVNVALDPIRFVTEAIQCLFAVEFIEWKKLTTGVFCEVTPGPEPESTTLK